MTKLDEKAEALRLRRKERLSLNEIRKRVRVSKSTLSLWLRNDPLLRSERSRKQSVAAKISSVRPRRRMPIPKLVSHFTRERSELALRRSAVAVSIEWFMSRGYMASIPFEQTVYDIVVDSDDGLRKIQVKSTTKRDRYGRFHVGICRNKYSRHAKHNASGRRKRRPYRPSEIDYLFIVTSTHDKYLIPIYTVIGKSTVTLGPTYAEYRV